MIFWFMTKPQKWQGSYTQFQRVCLFEKRQFQINSKWLQISYNFCCSFRSEDQSDNMMYAVDPRGQPVIYAYAGPPSIQVATWSDRSSRSSRARSAHTQEGAHGTTRSEKKEKEKYLRSISAGGANAGAFMAGAPPIPPPPAGYPGHPMYHQPAAVVLVPQPFQSPAAGMHPHPHPQAGVGQSSMNGNHYGTPHHHHQVREEPLNLD